MYFVFRYLGTFPTLLPHMRLWFHYAKRFCHTVSADRIKGNVVFICSAKTDPRGSEKVPNHDVINSAIKSLTARDANGLLVCNQCGVIEETVPLLHWAAVSCESDKLGTFVKVVSNTSYLQIAEIRIFGYPGKFFGFGIFVPNRVLKGYDTFCKGCVSH